MRLFVTASLLAVLSAPAPAALDAPPAPAGVMPQATAAGVSFTDAKGRALYTYAQDRPGKSACNAECAKIWPPLAAAPDAKPAGDWSVIKRDDGALQWAFRGKPLYTYIKDATPGSALGDRLGNAWNVVFVPLDMPPGVSVRAIYAGRVLTDARGLTLYTRSDEKPGAKPACVEKCLNTWTPLPAPMMAQAVGDWRALPREDGTLQWAYKGQRLYLNANDIKPAQMSGEGAEKVWHAAVLDPAPPLPAWVTVQRADMGEIFANAEGRTLYTFVGSMDKIKQTMCDDACMAKVWTPVRAEAGAKATGDWTILTEGGQAFWAYKGNIVHTHTRDKEPGAVGGDKWTAGVGGFGGSWNPLPRKRDFEEQ
ncbi:MAG: hypothetical protein JNK21_15915 [Rhodospirillaceae bacterium]|nr:hypothetical protein [Rhodospirillaceae bacterium]